MKTAGALPFCDAPVVPEPPARSLGLFRLLKQSRDNEIAVYSRDAFVNDASDVKFLFQRFVLLNHPEYIKHVLVTNHQNYPKSRLNRQILGRVLGQGLLTTEGKDWHRQRQIVAPAFHHMRIAGLAGIMTECAEATRERWQGAAERGEALDVFREMTALTMEITAKALFSRDVAPSVHEIGRAITVILQTFGKPSIVDILGLPEWLPRRRDPEAVEAIALLQRRVCEIITARRADPGERNDLLSMLLEARDEETGEGMTDRQLRDEIMTLFGAGHETTAVALTWTWYLLSQHPDVERRLHEELDRALGGRTPTWDDLNRLPYTRMVFEEAMRLYPPAFTMHRTALADDEIDGYKIRAGALITISPYVTHRNPKLWENPQRFDPERFTPEKVKARHRYAYLPFGAGPRVCIGNSFAMMAGRLTLATLARSYHLRLVPGHAVEAQGRITLRPRHGMRMTLKTRA